MATVPMTEKRFDAMVPRSLDMGEVRRGVAEATPSART